MLFQSYSMTARSDKSRKSSQELLHLSKAIKILRTVITYRIRQEAHSVQLNGFSKVLRAKPNSASSLPACHHAVTPAGKSELALFHRSKFRYVSACPCSCVLNESICHITYIIHTQVCIFSFLPKMGEKKGQAPGASAHKCIVLAPRNLSD